MLSIGLDKGRMSAREIELDDCADWQSCRESGGKVGQRPVFQGADEGRPFQEQPHRMALERRVNLRSALRQSFWYSYNKLGSFSLLCLEKVSERHNLFR